MESGWNLWVWLMGVVIRRWVWASGWNLWVWLVSVVVRRYIIDILIIIITFPYSTCISSFLDSIIPISSFIFKCFFCSCLCYFYNVIIKNC